MKVNDVIRSYELRQELGEGGFGKVFLAKHQTFDREVAMKVILPLYANQPDFIERFELEAQLVARLEHPNIVPLYDFWRDPNGAYLVMRLIRGGSLGDAILDATLKNELWDMERASKLLEQIASALHIAHRNRIVHQDIKPANIMLDEDGNAYLTDFGIARDLESDINLAQDANNVMHGSPKYISPEHLKRAEITHKSDIYSLGLLMYEVLTGEPPYDSTELLELLQMHLRRNIPPLQELRPDLPEALNAPLRQATTRNPDERYDSVLDFARDFNAIVQQIKYGGRAPLVTATGTALHSGSIPGEEIVDNPYKGLAAFQESDAADFFGRDKLINRLLKRLIERDVPFSRLLAVVGPSGSGKSSVVRAGVIPKIREGAIAGTKFYTATMIPGTNPMRSLEGAVLRVASRASDTFLAKLSQPTFDLTEVLDLSLAESGEMLLIIDQFEEVFTLASDPEIRDYFLKTVYDAINHPKSRLRVIITMRADFTGHALQIPGWGEIIQNRTELIPNLTAEELQEAIQKPAQRVGLYFRDGLIDLIIGDVQREVGSLPLLQYTLSELFDRRNGLELTLEAYTGLGGISGALAKRANEIYEFLTEEQKLVTQRVMPRLIKLGEGTEDTRRRELLQNLFSMHGDAAIVDAVLLIFQNGHLISRSYDENTSDIIIEVAHEALIRRWQLLRTWVDENREALRMQESLRGEVDQWHSAYRSPDFLARGDRLAQFRQLLHNNSIALNELEREYLVKSDEAQKAAERARQQRFVTAIAAAVVGVILAITASFFWRSSVASEREAVVQRDNANEQSTIAYEAQGTAIAEATRANEQSVLARSRELAASALLFSNAQPDRAVLLGLESIETQATFEGRNSLLTIMQSQGNLVGYFNGHSDFVRSVSLNSDSTLLATASRNGEVFVWDVASRKMLHNLEGHEGRVNNVVFSPDGSQVASTGFDGQLLIWDTSTWTIQHRLTWGESDIGWGLAFSPDSSMIALGDDAGHLILWDAKTGAEIQNLAAHTDPVYSVLFHPDGALLATGGGDNVVRLWDSASWETVAEFAEHSNWILDLAFSPDGRLLASASADTSIRFWDTVALSGLGRLSSHANGVRSIHFNNDGTRLFSADLDGVIIVTDLGNNQNSFSIDVPETIPVWSFDVVDNQLIVGGETDSVFVVNTNSEPTFPFERLLGTTGEAETQLAFAPDGTQVATGGGQTDDFSISVWNLETGERQRIEEHHNIVNDMAWNDDRFVSVDFDGLVVIQEDDNTRQFTVGEPILSVAVYGDILALGNSQGIVTLWDISGDEQKIAMLDAHASLVLDLDFSPDGRYLVSGGRDGTLTLWDVASLMQVGESWSVHTDDVLAVAFSPDGKFVASGSRDNSIIIWDVTSGQPMETILTGHTNWVNDVTYSPDGTLLASASTDGTVRLWDMITLRQLGLPLSGHTANVYSVDFSPGGDWIASTDQNGNVILWDMNLQNWIQAACAFANRGLSTSEAQEFFTGFQPVNVCDPNS